jgi:Icc protein
MPGIFYQPVNRRNFLKFSSTAVAAFAMSNVIGQTTDEAGQTVRLALLSDLHFPADPKEQFRKFFPVENLKSILPQVLATNPKGVLINGDLARLTGEVADYAALKAVLSDLAAKAPIYMAMGNHDNRDHFHKSFEAAEGQLQKVPGRYVLVVDHVPVRIIILDSVFSVSKTGGLLGKAQRDWLAKYLKNSDGKPVVIFVHHTLGDGDNELLDAEYLFEMAVPARQVKAIFYGHSHAYSFKKREDLHLINIPAVGYNFSDSEPVGWTNAIFNPKGVDLTLNSFGGNQKDNGRTTSLVWRT